MAKKDQGTQAVANWDKDLAARAQVASKQVEGKLGGQFFSVKGGVLALGGVPVPGNMAVSVVAAHIYENAYYEGGFDPDSPTSPVCFAFNEDEKEMRPHEKSLKPQAERCSKCEQNQFGTAAKGRGKACKNQMRLALLAAGQANPAGQVTVNVSDESLAVATPTYLRVPVTSVKLYAAYVDLLASGALGFKVPPCAVVTKVRPSPDPKNQVVVNFELIQRLGNEMIGTALNRNTELQASVGFPYVALEAPEGGKKPAAGRGAGGKKKNY